MNGYHPVGLADAFPSDNTQWTDTDADGYGDNWDDPSWNTTHLAWGIGQWLEVANTPMLVHSSLAPHFLTASVVLTQIVIVILMVMKIGLLTMGSDAFPLEPTQWLDTDRDGWGDNQTFGAARIDDFRRTLPVCVHR